MPQKVTAQQRVLEFGRHRFHTVQDTLFCTPCNKKIDHTRLCVIKCHLQSSKHIKQEKKVEPKACKQQHIGKATSSAKAQPPATAAPTDVCGAFTKALIHADIPLEKVRNSIMCVDVQMYVHFPPLPHVRGSFFLICSQPTCMQALFHTSVTSCIAAT